MGLGFRAFYEVYSGTKTDFTSLEVFGNLYKPSKIWASPSMVLNFVFTALPLQTGVGFRTVGF